MGTVHYYWTCRAYESRKACERLVMAIVRRLPRWLVYWCAIRLISHATTGRYERQVVPELHAMDALERWGDPDSRRPGA